MGQAIQLWTWWWSLLSALTPVFTRPGWVRFVQWISGRVLCWEEHTITQLLTAISLESRWRVLEHFAEYGAWDRETVERQTLRLLEQEHPARWGRYPPVAIDAIKLHRTSKHVWGTCTFHEASARSPKRAETVRAHNRVIMGDLAPGRPWMYLPHSAHRYGRKTPWPPGATLRTQSALAVELMRQADVESAAPLVGVMAGAYAVETVVRPCVEPEDGRRRIALVTRLRAAARRSTPAVAKPQPQGRPQKWGPRIAAPPHHLYWPVSWQAGRAWVYGRWRRFQSKLDFCPFPVSNCKCSDLYKQHVLHS